MRIKQMYQDVILDHYKHPHHRGLREPFGAQVHHVNPTCGDEVTLRVTLSENGDRIVDVSYDGQGCSISQAATSVLADQVIGQTIDDALRTVTAFSDMVSSRGAVEGDEDLLPLYDPCCGSGTIAIEAAQIACNIAPGSLRHFAFEKYLPFQAHVWSAIKTEAASAVVKPPAGHKALIYGSDVSHRMVDFAQRNAERAGVADELFAMCNQVLVEGGRHPLMRPAPSVSPCKAASAP